MRLLCLASGCCERQKHNDLLLPLNWRNVHESLSAKATSSEDRLSYKLPLNSQQSVVLGGSFRATKRASLDLPNSRSYRKIRDERILRLSGSMGDDRAITCGPGQPDRGERFRHGADLIQLDEDGIRDLFLNPSLKQFWIRDKIIVTQELDRGAHPLRLQFPAFRVLFCHPVFNGNDCVF